MSMQGVARFATQNIGAHGSAFEGESSITSIIVRLDNLPATGENRLRVLEHVRRLNRALEESGTPFRLRLL
jgi:hypothetical protein